MTTNQIKLCDVCRIRPAAYVNRVLATGEERGICDKCKRRTQDINNSDMMAAWLVGNMGSVYRMESSLL